MEFSVNNDKDTEINIAKTNSPHEGEKDVSFLI